MRLRQRHLPAGRQADLAPMVDVALLLVVFLLLTSEAIDERQLPVQLPEAATGEEAAAAQDLELTVMASGAVHHDGRAVPGERLEELAAGHRRAVLQVDRRCPHGEVVAVVDALRAAGVEHIVERTELPSPVDEW